MAEMKRNIYELKIVLKGVSPSSIWRQIHVPETYTFGHLSDAILSAMGWYGTHTHEFHMKDPITRKREIIAEKPESHDFCRSTIWENWAEIRRYFLNDRSKAIYIYDLGDGWIHEISLVKIIEEDSNFEYPRCVDGRGACPPEDCGGPAGFKNLLQLREKSSLTKYELEELQSYDMDGCNFDPDKFDPEQVFFLTAKLFNSNCCLS